MPPTSLNSPRAADTGHMLARPKSSPEGLARRATAEGGLPERERSGIGPTAGIIIILILIVFGALYFWGAYLNRKNSVQQLPFIPEESSTQESR